MSTTEKWKHGTNISTTKWSLFIFQWVHETWLA